MAQLGSAPGGAKIELNPSTEEIISVLEVTNRKSTIVAVNAAYKFLYKNKLVQHH